jgi:hypothetical protein
MGVTETELAAGAQLAAVSTYLDHGTVGSIN